MIEIRRICVYCGSSRGGTPIYEAAARSLGSLLAQAGIGLVYGGGGLGLMGAIARAVRAGGGHVTGIIPDFLTGKEGVVLEVDEHIIVPDMHTRKRLMFERADAFVALPGGVGTLEELVEMMTWAQLGRHGKPILIANIAGFWTPLLELLQHMTEAGFIRKRHTADLAYLVVERVEDILPALRNAVLPAPLEDAAPIERM